MCEWSALTDSIREGLNVIGSGSEDQLQGRSILRGRRGITCDDSDRREEVGRGRSCGAEDAEGEGGKCRESERAHDEQLRSVVVKE